MNQDWDKESLEWSEDEEDFMEEEVTTPKRPSNGNGKKKTTRFKRFLRKISIMDIVIAFTAVIIIVAGVILGITLKNKADIKRAQEEEVAEITGMYGKDTAIAVIFNSYSRDLKVKFTKKESGNLITDVDFDIDIVSPNGEEMIWTDEDEDGIIYRDNLEPGSYKVSIVSKDMFKYSTTAKEILVKDTYDFQKVDIMNETLQESSVDESLENGNKIVFGQDNSQILKDTVTYVESTKVEIPYELIDKSKLSNPEGKLNLTIGSLNDQKTFEYAGLDKEVVLPEFLCRAQNTETCVDIVRMVQSENGDYVRVNLSSVGGGNNSDPSGQGNQGEPSEPSDPIEPVTDPTINKLKLDQTELNMKIGDPNKTLITSLELSDNSVTSIPSTGTVQWESDKPAIAAITSAGVVEAKAVGEAIITAKYVKDTNTYTAQCVVKVTENTPTVAVSSIIFDPSVANSNEIKVGQKLQMKAKVTYSNNTSDDGTESGKLKWTSSKPEIAKIDAATGEITGIAKGEAMITVKYDGTTATVSKTIKVVEAVSKASKITISPESVTLNFRAPLDTASQSATAVATVTLTEGTDKTVKWTTSDAKIATVDANGKITAVGSGTATITATTVAVSSTDSTKYLATTMKVNVNGFTMKIDRTNEKILEGTAFTITPTMTNFPTGNIIWTTSNGAVANVTNGVVTGVGAGSATITATSNDKDINGKPIVLTCNVNVVKKPQNDTSTSLVTKAGKQVYIKKSNGEYVKASSSDYYQSGNEYYVATDNKCEYTGWQVIGGKTYYFDESKKVVTGTQIIKGMKYLFDENGVMQNEYSYGTDISSEDDSIDWDWVAKQGITFANIRVGYRGAANGEIVIDSKCRENIQKAQEAGITVGLYFESRALDPKQAIDEASVAIAIADEFSLYNCSVYVAPMEDNNTNQPLPQALYTTNCAAFMKTIQNSEYNPGVFVSADKATTILNISQVQNDCKVWISQCASELTYKGKCDLWQQGIIEEGSNKIRRSISFQKEFSVEEE